MIRDVSRIERSLKLIKPISKNTWELADHSRIEKITEDVNGKKETFYLRWVYAGGNRNYDSDWGEAEEFYSMNEVKKFATKLRHTTAIEIHNDEKRARLAGLEQGIDIYKDIKRKYSRKEWKKEIKKKIKEWNSSSARNEYGTYAEGIVAKLKQYYKGLS